MILFDGTYRLAANSKASEKPACAWHVRIIDMATRQPEIRHLKPFIVIAVPEGDGIFKSHCAGSLGRQICRDFSLKVKDILWVERFFDTPDHMAVASFRPRGLAGTETVYHIAWRPLMPNEVTAVKPFIPDIVHAETTE